MTILWKRRCWYCYCLTGLEKPPPVVLRPNLLPSRYWRQYQRVSCRRRLAQLPVSQWVLQRVHRCCRLGNP